MRYIKNWKPICLLSVDTKILPKALVELFKKYLILISGNQTVYVDGRVISDGGRLISGILDKTSFSKTLLTAKRRLAGWYFFSHTPSPTFLNTVNTDETFQQSGNKIPSGIY